MQVTVSIREISINVQYISECATEYLNLGLPIELFSFF